MLQTRKKLTVDRYSYKNKIYILCIIEHIPTYDTTMRATTVRQVHFTKQVTKRDSDSCFRHTWSRGDCRIASLIVTSYNSRQPTNAFATRTAATNAPATAAWRQQCRLRIS